MAHEHSIVDDASPDQVSDAIITVRENPQTRSKAGHKVLYALFKAPDHTLDRADLERRFPEIIDLHFGWICRRVAEELGDKDPQPFALVDHETNAEGGVRFRLKPNVVKAMMPNRS